MSEQSCDLTEYMGIKVEIHDPPTEEELFEEYAPALWIDEEKKILHEGTFAKYFRDANRLQYNNGLFYTQTGRETEEVISHDIWASIDNVGIGKNVEPLVKKLVGATKLASTVPSLQMSDDLIPFSNGDFYISKWEMHVDELSPVPYRLPVPLMFDIEDTPNFDKWLHDLFYPEDIKTVQEYLGYCLVQTTRAQKALFLIGEAGAGKSGMGAILESILGDADLNIPSTQEFMEDKFKLPELEHKLVLYDDDLDSAALTKTGLYKKLVTNSLTLMADRKFGQPFKFTPRVKLVACCNQMLSSVYDTSNGLFRRLLPIVVKPVATDFKRDTGFYDKLRAENRGIVQWALLGLRRLINNGWVLTESERSKNYMEQKQAIDNPLPDFMRSVFNFGEDLPGVPSADLMRVYEVWCRKNNCSAMRPRTVQLWLSDNSERYGISPSNHIPSGDKQVRGYKGLEIRKEWSMTGTVHLA